MSEMIERVAMAIAADIEDGFPRFTQQRWDELTELSRAAMRQRARVAITAMREPTEAMINVDVPLGGYGWSDNDCYSADPAQVWQAMVDEALKP